MSPKNKATSTKDSTNPTQKNEKLRAPFHRKESWGYQNPSPKTPKISKTKKTLFSKSNFLFFLGAETPKPGAEFTSSPARTRFAECGIYNGTCPNTLCWVRNLQRALPEHAFLGALVLV